jgi:hypothetical protein
MEGDFQHCNMQNVNLLKGDMFNENACYVGFVVTQEQTEFKMTIHMLE